MKIRTIHEQTMLKGVRHFLREHLALLENFRIMELAMQVDESIEGVDEAATQQVSGRAEACGGVAFKREKRRELREYLKDVARVGRSLDSELHPGLAERFRLPRSKAHAALAASARVIIGAAAPLEAEMIEHGLPISFLSELNALLSAFEAGNEAKIDGLQTQVGGTAALRHRAAAGVKAAQKLDAILRALFRNDPVMLERWRHARHIEDSARDANREPSADETESVECPAINRDATDRGTATLGGHSAEGKLPAAHAKARAEERALCDGLVRASSLLPAARR